MGEEKEKAIQKLDKGYLFNDYSTIFHYLKVKVKRKPLPHQIITKILQELTDFDYKYYILGYDLDSYSDPLKLKDPQNGDFHVHFNRTCKSTITKKY